jgi:HSP20 family molecular chaperone IbpA
MSLFSELIPSRFVPARRNGAVRSEQNEQFVVPAYAFKHADDAYGLEVFVPGVGKDAVEIQIDQGDLVVTARRRWKAPEGWTELFRETAEVDYRLRVELNDSVNVDKINAELENGVLRVTLPKSEALKPRKIEIS